MGNIEGNAHKTFTTRPFSDEIHRIAHCIKLLQNDDIGQSSLVLRDYLLIANAKMLEGIANTLIMTMPISKELKGDIEKCKLISKFDLALTLRTDKPLDYSNHLIGNITEIISARNKSVHPKISDQKFSSISNDSETNLVNFTLNEKNKDIDIFSSTSKMFNFLDMFFIDWCKCDGPYLSSLLCELVKFENGTIGILQNLNLLEDKKIIESGLNINIRFLSLIVQERTKIQQASISDIKSHKQTTP
jgi:hypothetical protein